jgi:hypothetical protein
MDKITLKNIIRIPSAGYQGCSYKVIASKDIEVTSIAAIKFHHTNIERGFITDTYDTYDAIRYAGVIYRIEYEIKEEKWIASRVSTEGHQGPQGMMSGMGKFLAEKIKIQFEQDGWAAEIQNNY